MLIYWRVTTVINYIHMAVGQNPGTPGEHQNSW